MAKLILSLDQVVVEEYLLDKARLTIGRRPSNDIQIDNLAVSGEHAVIVQIGQDFFVEDLDSTNGTVVNEKSIKKHLLKHADVITFGKFQLKYINEATLSTQNNAPDDFEKTMIIRPQAVKATATAESMRVAENQHAQGLSESSAKMNTSTTSASAIAEQPIAPASAVNAVKNTIEVNASAVMGKIQVLSGSSSGRELVLSKALTTLGKPGVQVAVITKRNNGYYITHVEGKTHPVVNGNSTGAQAHLLADHDVIELAGVKMEFYLVNA